MATRTVHKGYGVHDVYTDDVQIGICFGDDNGRTFTGRLQYKHVKVSITGVNSMRETTDRMAAIYLLLKSM